MARKKSTDTIDAEFIKVKADMSKLQDRYNSLAEKLKALQERKRRLEADAIMDAFLRSGKSFEEIIIFLNPKGVSVTNLQSSQ